MDSGGHGLIGRFAVLPADLELKIDPDTVKDHCMVDFTAREMTMKVRTALPQYHAQV
jgi:hypothetical protein